MDPRDVAAAIRRLRTATIALLAALSDDELEVEALPGWSVRDTLVHLADSDRRAVLLGHVAHFLPGRSLDALERDNDEAVAARGAVSREELRRELEVWGNRLAAVSGAIPRTLAKVRVPTAFGRVPVAWLGVLRPYDEWVHQWDVTHALDRPDPGLDIATRRLLATFHLIHTRVHAQPAASGRGIVEVRFDDADLIDRFPLGGVARFGEPEAVVVTDATTFSLVAAARVPWREVGSDGRFEVLGDTGTAAALLDQVRTV